MSANHVLKHQQYEQSMSAERYILGELAGAEREQFEEHYFECPECAESVRVLSDVRAGARAGLCGDARAAVVPPERWYARFARFGASWLQPQSAFALAALAIAAVTGYQNVQMRSSLQPQVLRSVTLQPATRGELPVVHTESVGAFVLLEADLPGAHGPLAWALRSAEGRTVMSGSGPAPEPGSMFKVLAPATAIENGDYILAVRSSAEREWVFRFRAEPR